MNEIDDRDIDELRRTFARRESDVAAPTTMPARARTRARRRELLTVAFGAIVAGAAVFVSVAGLLALRSSDARIPAGDGVPTTATINGITITYPQGWFVADPVKADIEAPADPVQLPALILFVSPATPADGTYGCPGLQDPASKMLMTVQEIPRIVTGPGSGPWPVEALPMDIDTGEAGDGGCYPEWTFLRSSWSAAGRSFEARIGFASDVLDSDRAALMAAYASMSFSPGSMSEGNDVTLGSGTAFDGVAWSLTARTEGTDLCWTFNSDTMGFGTCSPPGVVLSEPSVDLQPAAPHGMFAIVVVPGDVEAIVVVTDDGVIGDVGLFPLPAEWGDEKLAVIPLPGEGAGTIRFQDRSGTDRYERIPIAWSPDPGASPIASLSPTPTAGGGASTGSTGSGSVGSATPVGAN